MSDTLTVRPAEPKDYPNILRLNAVNVSVLAPMDEQIIQRFAEWAAALRVGRRPCPQHRRPRDHGGDRRRTVYNDASLRFHGALGFREVGTQYVRGGTIKVSLQAWEL